MTDFKSCCDVLYTAVLSDVLDSFGRRGQAMRPFVRPIDESLVMMGRVRTGLYALTDSLEEGENPYELEMDLVDGLNPGDVAVLACDGPTERIAPWGELLSTAASLRGAHGCVTDGLVRDVRQMRALGFPVFSGGIGPLDTQGRAKVVAIDTPVTVAGVPVNPGDVIFGDIDGVVVIPAEIEAEVLGAALAKVNSENATRDALREGLSLREVYDRYGVL